MITGAQIRMARGYLRWSAKELADAAGVAESTIKRMEQDEGFPIARGSNIEAVHKALTQAGIVFMPENGGGVGIRLRKRAAEPAGGSKSAAKVITGAGLARASKKSSEMAGEAIDRLVDKSAPVEEQARRKRRLIKGPPEFREMRRHKPKARRPTTKG